MKHLLFGLAGCALGALGALLVARAAAGRAESKPARTSIDAPVAAAPSGQPFAPEAQARASFLEARVAALELAAARGGSDGEAARRR
jgi:hypothetical protein